MLILGFSQSPLKADDDAAQTQVAQAQLKGNALDAAGTTAAALGSADGGAANAAAMINVVKAPEKGFFKRLGHIYWDDWHPKASDDAPAKFRGYPAPFTTPPYPFTVWPMGGTVTIGQPFPITTPLMMAMYGNKSGDWWKRNNITMYGWANVGMNFSTSSQANGRYANAPASYAQIPNSIQLDQLAFYIEKQPDTVQTDHFDWGFRLTHLYGMDYRFTTAKGYFSKQLLTQNADGSIGKKYGYDPVMAYLDFYFPKVAQGMNIRVGRYVSLPDIEAQLAPNNYTYTHSLLYTYDCYTQTGANATIKFTDHWTVQLGISPGCDTAPWKADAKLTGNACVAYTWSKGGDEIYLCANSLNDGRYAYNNLAAYYATWYHKFNSRWHTATESWYQYQSKTPNVNNPIGASMVQINSSGAFCNRAYEVTCYAPEWAALNYTNRQLGVHDFITFRNEYFDDMRGQRTGVRSKFVESGIGWNHWVGSTLLFRPEVRWEHAFNAPAYDGGTRRSQFMLAGDMIFFF